MRAAKDACPGIIRYQHRYAVHKSAQSLASETWATNVPSLSSVILNPNKS